MESKLNLQETVNQINNRLKQENPNTPNVAAIDENGQFVIQSNKRLNDNDNDISENHSTYVTNINVNDVNADNQEHIAMEMHHQTMINAISNATQTEHETVNHIWNKHNGGGFQSTINMKNSANDDVVNQSNNDVQSALSEYLTYQYFGEGNFESLNKNNYETLMNNQDLHFKINPTLNENNEITHLNFAIVNAKTNEPVVQENYQIDPNGQPFQQQMDNIGYDFNHNLNNAMNQYPQLFTAQNSYAHAYANDEGNTTQLKHSQTMSI